MEENVFWLRIWQSAFILAAIVTVSISSCTAYETSKVAEAVSKGADPIAARCGIVGNSGDSRNPICVVKANAK